MQYISPNLAIIKVHRRHKENMQRRLQHGPENEMKLFTSVIIKFEHWTLNVKRRTRAITWALAIVKPCQWCTLQRERHNGKTHSIWSRSLHRMVPQCFLSTFGCRKLRISSPLISRACRPFFALTKGNSMYSALRSFGVAISRRIWRKGMTSTPLVADVSCEERPEIDAGEGDIWVVRGKFLFPKKFRTNAKETAKWTHGNHQIICKSSSDPNRPGRFRDPVLLPIPSWHPYHLPPTNPWLSSTAIRTSISTSTSDATRTSPTKCYNDSSVAKEVYF